MANALLQRAAQGWRPRQPHRAEQRALLPIVRVEGGAEQLPLDDSPALPAAFVGRWRDLEVANSVAPAILEALEVLDAGPTGWWVVLRIGSKVVSSTCCASPEVAAEKAFRLWRLEVSKRAQQHRSFQWRDIGGVRRLVEVIA